MKTIMKLWILLLALIILTPLGLIIPEYFKSGAAWGEWGLDEIKKLVGYIPQGLAELSSIWKAPMPDYGGHLSGGCIISAIAGILIIIAVVYILGKFLTKKG